jgi:hypothetical protein
VGWCNDESTIRLKLRASYSAYLVLMGIWVVFGIGYLLLAIKNPGRGLHVPAVLSLAVSVAWWVWLRGFRILVCLDVVEYRNGLYVTRRVPRSSIRDIRSTWTEFNIFGKGIRLPRIVIETTDQQEIVINPKPFKRDEIGKLLAFLNSQMRS